MHPKCATCETEVSGTLFVGLSGTYCSQGCEAAAHSAREAPPLPDYVKHTGEPTCETHGRILCDACGAAPKGPFEASDFRSLINHYLSTERAGELARHITAQANRLVAHRRAAS